MYIVIFYLGNKSSTFNFKTRSFPAARWQLSLPVILQVHDYIIQSVLEAIVTATSVQVQNRSANELHRVSVGAERLLCSPVPAVVRCQLQVVSQPTPVSPFCLFLFSWTVTRPPALQLRPVVLPSVSIGQHPRPNPSRTQPSASTSQLNRRPASVASRQPVAAPVVSPFFSFSWIVLTRVPALPIVYCFRFTSHQQPLARSSTTANQLRPASLHPPSFVSLPALVISMTRRAPPTRVSTRISLSRASPSFPAFVPGEFNFSQSFWGIPTVPDVFAGFLKWFTIHCVCTCQTRLFGFRVSRSSAHDFMPQAGVSSATDAFAGILEPFTSQCAFPHTFGVFAWLSNLSSMSRHIFVLL